MTLTVRVITPDKTVWDQDAQEVILPSGSGQLGILTDHAPLLTNLDIGVLRVRTEKDWKSIAVMGGFAEVENNEVKVLVNGAELGESIDKETAKADLETAENELKSANSGGDRLAQIKANSNYKKARARLQATNN
ncbi:F0F1 ATP synthase subunit epsilon [Cyanobacterium stanieri LEGE 03274]|uniref:ATP synthase epsilon chain n=1 Tax=Cyanobacterium stanieri LEGE 03274 TaxID=1828756 RepID=A0ABR9V2W8_9CHRO|nr:ATP synthase F1 subunit epsilon [Cyanobacterium stanieri]MBE9222238.1 F0F1 ATP synthase subunit epsilon [Cyanobacterium stanieri LEGE 03274]